LGWRSLEFARKQQLSQPEMAKTVLIPGPVFIASHGAAHYTTVATASGRSTQLSVLALRAT